MYNTVIEHGYIHIPTGVVGGLSWGSKAILYLHGNKTSIERQGVLADMLHGSTGLPVVLPEYSGHGANATATYAQTMLAMHELEVVVAYDWLIEKVGERNVIVYGTSYGGSLAASLIKHRQPAQVILFAPTVALEDDFYVTRAIKPNLSPKINDQTPEEAVSNIRRATGSSKVHLTVMKSANDDMVADCVVDAWRVVYPEAKFVVLDNTKHSVRQSSELGRQEWLVAIEESLLIRVDDVNGAKHGAAV